MYPPTDELQNLLARLISCAHEVGTRGIYRNIGPGSSGTASSSSAAGLAVLDAAARCPAGGGSYSVSP